MQLISQQNLQKIIATDQLQRNYSTSNYYKPIISYFYLKKIELGLKMLGKRKYQNLLDVGFGAGVILPELSRYADKIEGIDIHKNIAVIQEIIKNENLNNVHLQYGNVLNLSFLDNYFDAIWCLSTLEFIFDYKKALNEIKRVAKDNATIIIGFPLTNSLTDFAYSLIGFKNKNEHQNNQKELLEEIEKNFQIIKKKFFPWWLPRCLRMYCVVKVIKK